MELHLHSSWAFISWLLVKHWKDVLPLPYHTLPLFWICFNVVFPSIPFSFFSCISLNMQVYYATLKKCWTSHVEGVFKVSVVRVLYIHFVYDGVFLENIDGFLFEHLIG